MDQNEISAPKPIETKVVSVKRVTREQSLAAKANSSAVVMPAITITEKPVAAVAVVKTDVNKPVVAATKEPEKIVVAEKPIAEKPAVESEKAKEPVVEKPKEVEAEQKKEEKKDEKETERWAALVKERRKLELDRSAFATERKEIEAVKAQNAAFEQQLLSIKNNPKLAFEVLDKLGLPLTKLVDYALNPETVDKDYEVKRLKEQYEADKAAQLKTEKENQTAQQKANVEAYKSNLRKFIDGEDGNNSAYPLIRANDEHELVYQVMDEQYRLDGTEMDKSKAAKLVEDFLQEKLDKQLKAKKLNVNSEVEPKITEEKTETKVKATAVLPQKAIKKADVSSKPNLNKVKLVTNTYKKSTAEQSRIERAVAAYEAAKSKK